MNNKLSAAALRKENWGSHIDLLLSICRYKYFPKYVSTILLSYPSSPRQYSTKTQSCLLLVARWQDLGFNTPIQARISRITLLSALLDGSWGISFSLSRKALGKSPALQEPAAFNIFLNMAMSVSVGSGICSFLNCCKSKRV